MTDRPDQVAALRQALAAAERARDEATAAAARLRDDLAEHRREGQNRLRNMLSVMRAIVRRTGDEVDSAEAYRGVLDGRLASYARIQVALEDDPRRGADLALLLGAELLHFGLREGAGVDLHGPTLVVKGSAAGTLALAFHELASALVAAGLTERTGGGLSVSWSVGDDADRPLRIDWSATLPAGQGAPMAGRPTAWIERAIAHQLAGTLAVSVTATGYAARFALPLGVLHDPQHAVEVPAA